ncbi:MAG: cytochrome c3 family protein [Thermodesulfobacteriota bacterium]|nr:cytochrome c3 family protein [Thermodesulfobacteriota bacterium]
MKTEIASWKMVLAGVVVIALHFAGATLAWASIPDSGIRCQGCHVNPGGGELLTEYAGNQGCINCHSSSNSSTTYELDLGGGSGQTVTVPVVCYTGASAPGTYLDGGNFWWVKEGLGGDDSKGHNIFSGEPDDLLTAAPMDATTCGTAGPFCHVNLHQNTYLHGTRQGCTNCHMVNPGDGAYGWTAGFHHADDSDTVVGTDTGDDDGFFRFLVGHQNGSGHGVCGIEDADWQSTSPTDHSEYLGNEAELDAAGSLNFSPGAQGHTMTGFCCGCHGEKHISSADPGGGNWIRHPSGAVVLDDLYTEYNPQVPVSRPNLSGYSGPSSTVTSLTDMVMCLSCHRAHGSPYPKMLRWDSASGCGDCHISAVQCAE